MFSMRHLMSLVGVISAGVFVSPSHATNFTQACRYLPGDKDWPTVHDWLELNSTVHGRLISTVPLAAPCYGASLDAVACDDIKDKWVQPELHVDNPASVQNPYWLNNSCSPFTSTSGSCTNGNIAEYSINVTDAEDAIAGVKFSQEKNIRLVIKNTGHDFLGRSTGKGSINIWTHNLKNISIFDYSSTGYTGRAVRMGAGVQGFEAYRFADENGVRIIGGFCPTVGLAGGYTQGAGHGPLIGEYGLAADNALEWEVVTAEGKHLIATPSQNSDLYWALSGGGPGTYGIVLSLTTKAHPDGPVGGAWLLFNSTSLSDNVYWDAVHNFHTGLSAMTDVPGVQITYTLSSSYLNMTYLTWPGHNAGEVEALLRPFTLYLEANEIPYDHKYTYQPGFYPHYAQFTPELPFGYYEVSEIIGGRLIPHSVVEESSEALVSALRNITSEAGGDRWITNGVATNLTHARVGNTPESNSVLPAWRDSLVFFNIVIVWDPATPIEVLSQYESQMTEEQVPKLERITPGGGTYINEGDFNNPNWKEDYFGGNYERLLVVKKKYDPHHLFYGIASVGSEMWIPDSDGRLCKAEEN